MKDLTLGHQQVFLKHITDLIAQCVEVDLSRVPSDPDSEGSAGRCGVTHTADIRPNQAFLFTACVEDSPII